MLLVKMPVDRVCVPNHIHLAVCQFVSERYSANIHVTSVVLASDGHDGSFISK